ncbi:MAG: PKD domain-containing protein, partial [Cyclobacteriaceae bacterium]
MNFIKINKAWSVLLIMLAGLLIVSACENEEVDPAVSAFFKTRNIIDTENPLEAPASVVFVNGSRNALSYHWDFGDAYLKNDPTHSNTYVGISPDTVYFPVPGNYEITVMVRGSKDGNVETYKQNYTVAKQTPVISFAPEEILPGTEVTFNVSFFQYEDATPTYNWTFPDAEPESSTEASPTISFTSAGTKTVTLEVFDGEETLSVQAQVVVKEELAPTLYFTDMATNRIFKKRIFDDEDKEEAVSQSGIILRENSRPMTMMVHGNTVLVANTENIVGSATFGEIISFRIDGTN